MRLAVSCSDQFWGQRATWGRKLREVGHEVNQSSLDTLPPYRDERSKAMIDAIYQTGLLGLDALVVLDIGGYIGTSTRGDIKLFKMLDLPIYYVSKGEDVDTLLRTVNRDGCHSTPVGGQLVAASADTRNRRPSGSLCVGASDHAC